MATSLRMLFAIHLLSLTYSATPARSQAHIRFEAGTKPGRQSKTAIASRLKAPSATDPSELPPGVAYPPPTLASGGDVVEDPLLLVSNCSANIRSRDAVFGDKFAQPIWRHAEFLAAILDFIRSWTFAVIRSAGRGLLLSSVIPTSNHPSKRQYLTIGEFWLRRGSTYLSGPRSSRRGDPGVKVRGIWNSHINAGMKNFSLC